MALVKITFDSASVTAKQDADLNHFLVSGQNGRILGLGNEVKVTTSNNYIILSSGYVQVYGRRVYVEANTKIAVTLTGSAYGYVVIRINLGDNTVTLAKIEAASTYPALTKENLLTGGLIYELPVARYTKTTSSLTLDANYDAPSIKSANDFAEEKLTWLEDNIKTNYGPISQGKYTTSSGKKFYYEDINLFNADKGVGNIYIISWHVVFSTKEAAGSGVKYQYKIDGVWYDVWLQLTASGLVVTTSSELHKPGAVYVVR